jgi:hypothetical protein
VCVQMFTSQHDRLFRLILYWKKVVLLSVCLVCSNRLYASKCALPPLGAAFANNS